MKVAPLFQTKATLHEGPSLLGNEKSRSISDIRAYWLDCGNENSGLGAIPREFLNREIPFWYQRITPQVLQGRIRSGTENVQSRSAPQCAGANSLQSVAVFYVSQVLVDGLLFRTLLNVLNLHRPKVPLIDTDVDTVAR